MTREEAIKEIKAWDFYDNDKEVIETLIPELKESKDKRVSCEIESSMIMDTYEEKYKKALKRARMWQNHLYETNDKGDRDYADELNYIFPELTESEDEKVKRILHSISSKMSFHLCDIFTEEEFQCFDAWSNAWLEKQGKQKVLEEQQ